MRNAGSDDDFVKTLGDFKDVPDFKDKLSAMVAEEKKGSFREKRRLKIAEAIGDATEAEIPDIMIESELDRTEASSKPTSSGMGVKIDDYLETCQERHRRYPQKMAPGCEKKEAPAGPE